MKIAILIALCFAFVSVRASADEPAVRPPASAQDIEYFEKKIRPLLAKRCFSCHSSKSKSVKGGLKLDSAGAWFAGGDSGPAVVAGDPANSLPGPYTHRTLPTIYTAEISGVAGSVKIQNQETRTDQ